MRDQYHEQLDGINDELSSMALLVSAAITKANEALLQSNLGLAEEVIGGDAQIDAAQHSIEQTAFGVLALQQPVASDLRFIIAALRISATLERMGDLARHIAQSARRRFPESAVPDQLRHAVSEMSALAEQMSVGCATVISTRDVDAAWKLETEDDRMDELHRELFMSLVSEDWQQGVESAIDMTLISRYHERFADHAVSAALRVVQLVTGQPYEELTAPN